MTASKSSRARNARIAGQASSTRASSTSASSTSASSTKAGAAKGGAAVKNGSTARNGGATGNGQARTAAVRNGAVPRPARGAQTPVIVADSPQRGPAVWLQVATFVLALAGLGVSIYLTIAHFTESTLAGCSESGLVNCTKVTTSPQSYVFGIPVAVLGLAFYLFAVAIMSPWAWQATRREIHLLRIASMVVGIGFVLYLIYAELFIIGSICLYCTSVHAITFLLFVLTAIAAAAWGLVPGAAWKSRPARQSD